MTDERRPFTLTKIIATLGPASREIATVTSLIEEGASLFRVNFSHGSLEEHEGMVTTVREAARRAGAPVGVIGDLAGPKVRVGEVVEGGVVLEPGTSVEFQREPVVAGTTGAGIVFSTTHEGFVDEVEPGQRVLLDDGAVRLICVEKRGGGAERRVVCTVVQGGRITRAKGVNLPDTDLSLPSLTERDHECIRFAVERGFDFLALSFVRSAGDVRALQGALRELGARPDEAVLRGEEGEEGGAGPEELRRMIPVIAKIEKPQALSDIEAIVEAADGVMVARGDLGVEMELAEVPILQKRIVALCHEYGKPVIVATQMLQSMIESPGPTRAEVSDVANAIFDRVDAVMLSGETAVGRWPVRAVRMMREIAWETDTWVQANAPPAAPPRRMRRSRHRAAALARGVEVIARDAEARLLVIWSQTGAGALSLSRNHLPLPVLAVSSSEEALRRMTLLYGLEPVFMPEPASTAEFIRRVEDVIVERGLAARGDAILLLLGEPIHQAGRTNKLCIHQLPAATSIVKRVDDPDPG